RGPANGKRTAERVETSLGARDGDLLDLGRSDSPIAFGLDTGEGFDDRVWSAAPEDRVAAVQVRRRGVGDEELHSVGVGAAVRHAQETPLIVTASLPDLVRNDVAGLASPGAQGIASLNHEALHDPMKG